MKNDIIKRLFIICLALTVVLPGTTVSAKLVLSKKDATKYINTIAHRQMSTVKKQLVNFRGVSIFMLTSTQTCV